MPIGELANTHRSIQDFGVHVWSWVGRPSRKTAPEGSYGQHEHEAPSPKLIAHVIPGRFLRLFRHVIRGDGLRLAFRDHSCASQTRTSNDGRLHPDLREATHDHKISEETDHRPA